MQGKTAQQDGHIRLWLACIAVLVYAMMLLGGLTRLTDSGLSITEWKLVTGILPPGSENDWQAAFAAYKRDAFEFKAQNHGMSLAEFKIIYWWEWGHRFLGRVIGLAFLVPFVVFVVRGWIGPRLRLQLLALFGLGGFQGLVGWWMVTSGIGTGRIDVAPYRLMVHFSLALAIIGWCVWLWLDLGARKPLGKGRAWALVLGLMVAVQMLLGALTAGLDAGLIYNDWPLMDGHAIAPEIWALTPPARNLIENPATVQFFHRSLAYALVAVALVAAMRFRNEGDPGFAVIAGLLAAQTGLGVLTLVHAAPLAYGIGHQALGIATAVWMVRCLWMTRSPSRQPLTNPVCRA